MTYAVSNFFAGFVTLLVHFASNVLTAHGAESHPSPPSHVNSGEGSVRERALELPASLLSCRGPVDLPWFTDVRAPAGSAASAAMIPAAVQTEGQVRNSASRSLFKSHGSPQKAMYPTCSRIPQPFPPGWPSSFSPPQRCLRPVAVHQ